MDHQNQMLSMNNEQKPGLQQVLVPSGSGQLPLGLGDNQAKDNVARKTIYTRTELLSCGQPTTQYDTVPEETPHCDKATCTTKSLTEIGSEMDLTVELGQIKKTPSVH